ncbi:MAG TPA: hypothetical protein PK205_18660 [Promineifilum sp.]|nr:hypothetical protein [Promineifilum sp.]
MINAITTASIAFDGFDAIINAGFVRSSVCGSRKITCPLANGSLAAANGKTFSAKERESWFCATGGYLIANRVESLIPKLATPAASTNGISAAQIKHMLQLMSKCVAKRWFTWGAGMQGRIDANYDTTWIAGKCHGDLGLAETSTAPSRFPFDLNRAVVSDFIQHGPCGWAESRPQFDW